MNIKFEREVCQNPDLFTNKEWLETNGLGGFASSTIAGLNSRRYHGLLVAATKPPVGKYVLLSKLEETMIVHGQRYELGANQYPGVVHPRGFMHLLQFRLDPFPIFTYEINGVLLEKTVFMIHGENSTVIRYELKGNPEGVFLEVRPLIAFRDYHSATHENNALNGHLDVGPGRISITPYQGLPTLHLNHDQGHLNREGFWYRNFEYKVELERGLDFREDLYSPCALTFDLSKNSRPALIASMEIRDTSLADQYREKELQRRESVVRLSPFTETADDFTRALLAAADQYIADRGDQKTIIAGYHWFSDWGRDTMISLPGLTLVTGRPDAARGILLAFARYVDRGMLPNRFSDAGEQPEYNTVDATLWYFEAIQSFLRYTDDYEFVQSNLFDILVDIIGWHIRGTRYGIRMDEDGLLFSGEPGVQLTWMDAKVGDWVVTPRSGKAVEIQALWYNALRILGALAQKFGNSMVAHRCNEIAERGKTHFTELFWNEDSGCLYDVVNSESKDGSIRPNQIFTLSLTYPIFEGEKAGQIVDAVYRHLYTPVGLRSLAPGDAQYRGRYQGDPRSRDGAYHQGTVWPWLMGPFITAYLRVHGASAEARARVAQWLEPFQEHLLDAGLGQISEVFDGDAPHRPGGCMAQAWSVAELLRVAAENRL